MDYWERDTSRMGTSRVKQESKRVVRNLEQRNVGTKRKRPKRGLSNVEDLTIELPKGRENFYHR